MNPKDVGIWKRKEKLLLRLNDKYELWKVLNSFQSMEDVEMAKKSLLKSFGYHDKRRIQRKVQAIKKATSAKSQNGYSEEKD